MTIRGGHSPAGSGRSHGRLSVVAAIGEHDPVALASALEADGWTGVHDAVAVGGGAAGFAAALTAAAGGAQVLLLEKASRPGGTTRRSGGQYWIPDNSLMRAAGLRDDRTEALHYMARLAFPTRYRADHPTLGADDRAYALLQTYVEQAPRAIDELGAIGALRSEISHLPDVFAAWGSPHQPDYHADLQPNPVLGRQLNAVGGMTGIALVEQLQDAAARAGIDVRCRHHVVALVADEHDRIVGVGAETPDGIEFHAARRGVVFGTGGFAQDRELVGRYLRGDIVGTCAVPSNTGDFLRLATQCGADVENLGNAWWNQVAVEDALANPNAAAAVWIPYGDSMIIVNRVGRRVVNEKAIYNERAQVHFAWDPTTRSYVNSLLFMLFDSRVAFGGPEFDFRWPVPRLESRDLPPHVIRGYWWDDLADRIDARLRMLGDRVGNVTLAPDFLDELLPTIQRFNEQAEKGVDTDFGRHATSRLAWHDPSASHAEPTTLMHPLSEDGPFFCVILGLGALDTKGGPCVDVDARIVDSRGAPIVGLYGAGNCVASPAGQAYWAPGTTIGMALTFGFLAGQHLLTLDDADVAP